MNLIESESLEKRYEGGVTALAGLTVAVEPGIVGLVGANGAGKSTLIKLALGLLAPTAGSIRVLGLDPIAQGEAVRARVGYMPEYDCLPPDVAGRLAASGDYRHIRRLMTNRPHVFLIQSSDDRRLGTVLMQQKSVSGVELDPTGLQVRTNHYGTFTRALARTARDEDIRLTGILPTDESLEDVFSYLVAS